MSAPSVEELRTLSPRALRRLVAEGYSVASEHLEEKAYFGVSLGIPHWVERFAWTTFVKTFHRDPETGALRGWNVRIDQTGLDGPVHYKSKPNGDPQAWGFYEVVGARDGGAPRDVDQGLLIDYGRGGNGRLDPMSRIRDPLVALSPDDPAYLLGASYADLGLKFMTPSYFLLHRPHTLDHLASAG
jgi:hypothetical protein